MTKSLLFAKHDELRTKLALKKHLFYFLSIKFNDVARIFFKGGSKMGFSEVGRRWDFQRRIEGGFFKGGSKVGSKKISWRLFFRSPLSFAKPPLGRKDAEHRQEA